MTVTRRALRRHLIAGLLVIAPVTVTLAVLWWIFQLLDGLIGRFLYPALSRFVPWIGLVPGLGLLCLFLLLLGVGWAAERAIGSRIVEWWHQLLERIPVTRRIYGAANRIVRTILGQDSRPFKGVVLIEYPSAGRWSVGFLAADAPGEIQDVVAEGVSVFVPTTPNPTSGWVVIVPRSKTILLSMSVDEAFTYLLSGGSVLPDEPKRFAAAADDGRPAVAPWPDATVRGP
jgi:uncharacterized membrane protein